MTSAESTRTTGRREPPAAGGEVRDGMTAVAIVEAGASEAAAVGPGDLVAAVTGAFVMTGASILSKLIAPGAVVPIGIVTAVIGVPFLFALILHGRRRNW